jgi:succinate dehydrogenase/fumarate reductase flavoprotein subunit
MMRINNALIIGGGIAGMSAAIRIAARAPLIIERAGVVTASPENPKETAVRMAESA